MPVSGQAAPTCDLPTTSISTSTHWDAPLSRTITLGAQTVTLKDALDRLAAAGKLRFSYSAELLPLDKSVCIAYKRVSVGDALADLLRGIAVTPVIAGADHVVLTPSVVRASAAQSEWRPQPLIPLDPVFATAAVADPLADQGSFAYSRLNRRQLSTQASVGAALNTFVPGVWAWQSPAGFTSLYSVRGASSFGASAPKVFVDGIEVANPLIVTQIQPDNIERIEMIRGPQGAALYGADALSGVTNIVTRRESTADGAPRVRVRSGFALSSSDYASSASVGQDHTVSLQLGSRARSGSLNFGLGKAGEYMPGAYARHASLDGNMRLVGARTIITGTARLFTQYASNPTGLVVDSSFGTPAALSMQQYTLGVKGVYSHSERLAHSFVFGVDGFALNGMNTDSTMPLSPTDSILRAAGEGALRTTLRLSSVAHLGSSKTTRADVTLAAENSGLYRYEIGSMFAATQQLKSDHARSATAISAQFDATLFGRVFLNSGLRLEHDVMDGVALGTAALPMLGASYVATRGDLSVKLRASYGKGIRWPELSGRAADYGYMQAHVVRKSLAPEQQSGVEAGIDVTMRGTMGFQVTRYDQIASGLQQTVLVPAAPGLLPPAPGQQQNKASYTEQSVGEIGNSGWEMQAFMRRGALALTGTMSLTDSRVLRIADGYTGDLRPGDRMLAVPARTMSIDASWLGKGWSTSLTAARAFDWINYDRVSLIAQTGDVSGAQLRNFWQQYNGFTHLRTTLTRDMAHGFTLMLVGDNLLNKQVGEPDNLTGVPGRTISVGVRAAF